MCHCKNKQTIPTCHGNGLARFEVGSHQAWIWFAPTTFQDPKQERRETNWNRYQQQKEMNKQEENQPEIGNLYKNRTTYVYKRKQETQLKQQNRGRIKGQLPQKCRKPCPMALPLQLLCGSSHLIKPFPYPLSMLGCMCMERWQPPLPHTNSIPSLIVYCARTNAVTCYPLPTLSLGSHQQCLRPMAFWRKTALLQIPIYMPAAPPQSYRTQRKSPNEHALMVKNKHPEMSNYEQQDLALHSPKAKKSLRSRRSKLQTL